MQAYNSADVSAYSITASATTLVASDMRVSALISSSVVLGKKWNATVQILVTESGGDTVVADATVTGSWSEGATGTAECITDGSGQCPPVTKNSIKTSVLSVTFTVVDVTHATYTYDEENSVTEIVVLQ